MKKVLEVFVCVVILLISISAASAEEKETRFEEIVVTAPPTEAVPPAARVPAVVESITKEDFEKMNVKRTEDVIEYMPGLHIRQFYPGSGSLHMRGTPLGMTYQRALVQADGIMLSDFVSTPRWNLITPEEIERVDVIYGPYSALYSGNTLGGAVLFTTKLPEKREFGASTSFFYHNFREYKTDEDLLGNTAYAFYGDKIGKFRFFGLFDRFENDNQPVTFLSRLKIDGKAPVGSPAYGWASDEDQQERERYILGSNHRGLIKNDLFKLKLGYDINSYTQAIINLAYWASNTDVDEPETYLRDGAGNKVWSGDVDIDGRKYTIRPSDFFYQEQTQDNYIYAASFKREPEDGVKIWATASFYNIPKGLTQQSTTAPPMSKHGGPGTVTDADSGWYTFDFKSSYRPSTLPALANHTLTGGHHYDRYFTDSEVWNASDWKRDIRTTLSQGSEGKTGTHAVFLQDEWDLTDKWMLYLGGRYEWWSGFDGSKSKDVGGSRVKTYLDDRKEDHFSPKVAITCRPDGNWDFRVSLAKAYRFPVTSELYYAKITPGGLVTETNPDLKSEKVFAKDLTILRNLGENGKVRLSFFENFVDDTIFRQVNYYTGVQNYQNVDEVRARGVEFAIEKKGFLLEGLDSFFNIVYTKADILKNANLPASEGKDFPRVPEWTCKAAMSYTPIKDLILTVGGRYATAAFMTLENIDKIDHDRGYGSQSEYLVFDAKILYKFLKNFSASVGVDNLTDELYHSGHPYSRRVFSAELKGVF